MTAAPQPELSEEQLTELEQKASEIRDFNPLNEDWDDDVCEKAQEIARSIPALLAMARRSVPGDVRAKALVEILADIDAVDDGTLSRISSATISRARQAVGEWSPGVAKERKQDGR